MPEMVSVVAWFLPDAGPMKCSTGYWDAAHCRRTKRPPRHELGSLRRGTKRCSADLNWLYSVCRGTPLRGTRCAEIIEYTHGERDAVCNLASVSAAVVSAYSCFDAGVPARAGCCRRLLSAAPCRNVFSDSMRSGGDSALPSASTTGATTT